MGPDLEMQGRSEATKETLSNKDNESILKPTEDKHMLCASNYKGKTFKMGTLQCEQNEKADGSGKVELNLVDSKSSHVNALVQSKSPDMTDSSSSFGNTLTDVEIDENGSDAEVVSEFHGNSASVLEFDGSDDLLRIRKKRLTNHWRTFIQPIMWRAKWAEMQIRKFQSLAFKYDKILAENEKRKQLKVDSFAPGLCAKAQPYANESQRGKLMKRRKRKRSEDLIDNAMSNHTLFSYFANITGNRSSIANAASNGTADWEQQDAKPEVDEEVGATNGPSILDIQEDSNSWEHLLEKIVMSQLKVGDLKDRMHKVTSENAGKISWSTDNLSLLVPHNNALTGSIMNPASPPNNGDRMGIVGHSSIASQLVHAYNNNMGDLVMPQSAASSHGEVTPFPDIIESMDQPRVGGSWTSTGDGFLIHNARPNEELNNFGEVKIHPIDKKLKAPKVEQDAKSPTIVAQEIFKTDDQPSPKIVPVSNIITPNIKKKRGKRKARTGKWSRRSTG